MIDLDRILPEQHPDVADRWLADGLDAVANANRLANAAPTPIYGSWSRATQEATRG